MGAGMTVQGILLCLAVLFFTLVDSSTESSGASETPTSYVSTTSNVYSENITFVDTWSNISTTQTPICEVENCKLCESGRFDSCALCEDSYKKTDEGNHHECVCKNICHSCHSWFWVCIVVPVVGGLILIGTVIGIICCVRRCRCKKRSDDSPEDSPNCRRRSPPSKNDLDRPAIDLPIYENVERPCPATLKKDIEENCDRILRYTKEPTVKDQSNVTGGNPMQPPRRSYPTESTFYDSVDDLQAEVKDTEEDIYENADEADYVNEDLFRSVYNDPDEQEIYENVPYHQGQGHSKV